MSDVLIMWSIAQIVERDGISKQAVSKQIKKMLDAKPDTPVELDALGRLAKVSLAHYDEFRQRYLNPAKVTASIRPPEAGAGQPQPEKNAADSFEEARRIGEWLKVSREKIRHQEDIGQLLRSDRVAEAVRISGAEIKTVVARLANHADDLALAVSKEGVHGVRMKLRAIAFELGNEIADKLEAIAATAPETDALIADDQT